LDRRRGDGLALLRMPFDETEVLVPIGRAIVTNML
jgi:hypothetical protein